MKTNINSIIFILIVLLGLIGSSCTKYLDVVPDNIPTIDNAFNKRYQAKGYLYGCYSFMPSIANPEYNPAFFAGDEAWTLRNLNQDLYMNYRMWTIALGGQGTNAPVANYWASKQDGYDNKGGTPLYTAIRDCNIFLENIHNTLDQEDWERDNWIGEVKFLKAYYCFWLFRMYGPIPVIKGNIPISATSEVEVFRQPVDSVVNYIVTLLDEAAGTLPMQLENISEEIGRITKPIALALKGQVLTYAASPLFNGNPDYADFVDKRGIHLFPTTYDPQKWEKAAAALKEAIAVAHEAGHKLYTFQESGMAASLNPKTVLNMQVRGAATERWNNEIIWGASGSDTYRITRISIPAFSALSSASATAARCYSPPLHIVEQFYTKSGVPMEEDKDWIGIDWLGLRKAVTSDKWDINPGITTANMYFDREARFYGSISFEGGMYYGNGQLSDASMPYTGFRSSTGFNSAAMTGGPVTGHLAKKPVHRLSSFVTTATSPTYYRYAFPIIRLADLYLMYAEALNEVKGTPDSEVYEYIDLVRNRTGLSGVVESWAAHSIHPEKPLTQEGMREIIKKERMIELAFEGQRFWDLRRWKLAKEYMNKPIRGLNVYQSTNVNEFFTTTLLGDQPGVFENKDYLWPISESTVTKNSNLVQNPGW